MQNNYFEIGRRNRATAGERKKWPQQPNRESNLGPVAFLAISLPVKLLGQARLRPNHGATPSLSSRKNERKMERMKERQWPTLSHRIHCCPWAPNPVGSPQTRVGWGRGENIFKEHSGWAQKKTYAYTYVNNRTKRNWTHESKPMKLIFVLSSVCYRRCLNVAICTFSLSWMCMLPPFPLICISSSWNRPGGWTSLWRGMEKNLAACSKKN